MSEETKVEVRKICDECGKESNKDDLFYDAENGEHICESHLQEDTTGYCSTSCRRGFGCDGSC